MKGSQSKHRMFPYNIHISLISLFIIQNQKLFIPLILTIQYPNSVFTSIAIAIN